MGGGTTQDDVLEVTNNLRSPPTTSLRRPHGDQKVPKVVETSLTGENWSSFLSEPDADGLLGKELMVVDPLTRRKLIGV